jgi:hypothetical protein
MSSSSNSGPLSRLPRLTKDRAAGNCSVRRAPVLPNLPHIFFALVRGLARRASVTSMTDASVKLRAGPAPSMAWMSKLIRIALAVSAGFSLLACTAVVPVSGTGGTTQVAVDAAATGGAPLNGAGGGAGIGGTPSGSGGVGSGGSNGAGAGGGAGGRSGVGGGMGIVDGGRDTSAPDAGTSTALCPPTALVCEDFEDGQANGWSPLATGMSISTAHASSGTNSLAITIPANAGGGMITYKGAPLFPLANKTMWGRVMVWFDSISDGHTDIIRGQAASGGNPTYNVAEQHGAYMLNYYNGSSATDCWARPVAPTPTVVPLAKWMCWEWRFDAANNDMQFFVDGALYRRVTMTGDGCLTGNGVWVAPPDFGLVGIGANIAERRPTVMQMWFDDIAIGTQARIGCPAR